MKYRLGYRQTENGTSIINGRPHGFVWKEQWEVTFSFESKDERKRFINEVRSLFTTDDEGNSAMALEER